MACLQKSGISLIWLLCAPLLAAAGELAGVEDPIRAKNNYMLNCQGCHGPLGEGNTRAEVPRMQGFVGNFLRVEGGREFMVQVPGSANTGLGDQALAELLNWMLPTMSGTSLPGRFVPYGTEEVARLRKSPEIDVIGRRAGLIEAMQAQGIETD